MGKNKMEIILISRAFTIKKKFTPCIIYKRWVSNPDDTNQLENDDNFDNKSFCFRARYFEFN